MEQITAEERQRRQRAIDFARGSVRYEAFILSAVAEAIGGRFVAGELTRSGYVTAMLAISNTGPDSRAWNEGQITAARIVEYQLDVG